MSESLAYWCCRLVVVIAAVVIVAAVIAVSAFVVLVIVESLCTTSTAATATHQGFHSIPTVFCCRLAVVHFHRRQTLSSLSTAPAIAPL